MRIVLGVLVLASLGCAPRPYLVIVGPESPRDYRFRSPEAALRVLAPPSFEDLEMREAYLSRLVLENTSGPGFRGPPRRFLQVDIAGDAAIQYLLEHRDAPAMRDAFRRLFVDDDTVIFEKTRARAYHAMIMLVPHEVDVLAGLLCGIAHAKPTPAGARLQDMASADLRRLPPPNGPTASGAAGRWCDIPPPRPLLELPGTPVLAPH